MAPSPSLQLLLWMGPRVSAGQCHCSEPCKSCLAAPGSPLSPAPAARFASVVRHLGHCAFLSPTSLRCSVVGHAGPLALVCLLVLVVRSGGLGVCEACHLVLECVPCWHQAATSRGSGTSGPRGREWNRHISLEHCSGSLPYCHGQKQEEN